MKKNLINYSGLLKIIAAVVLSLKARDIFFIYKKYKNTISPHPPYPYKKKIG